MTYFVLTFFGIIAMIVISFKTADFFETRNRIKDRGNYEGSPQLPPNVSMMFLTRNSDAECISKAAKDNHMTVAELKARLDQVQFLEVFVKCD